MALSRVPAEGVPVGVHASGMCVFGIFFRLMFVSHLPAVLSEGRVGLVYVNVKCVTLF